MNEREIIKLFGNCAGKMRKDAVRGIGDDCAVLQLDSKKLCLVTMDTLIEEIHFNNGWHPPHKLGWKSVAVNVSDIAAMGGRPVFAFLSLGLPKDFDPDWLEQFAAGLTDACRHYDCSLAGGDTVRSSGGIVITLTVIGEVSPDRILYRSNAWPGDEVWVSGTLGNAAAGLELCRTGRAADPDVAELVDSHLQPNPRMELSGRLAASGLVHSMMDMSDGLATDLAQLCTQSKVGAVIYAGLLPVSGLLRSTAEQMNTDFLQWALAGGEDYELLFTAPPQNKAAIMNLAEEGMLTQVGYIDENLGVRLAEGKPGQRDLSLNIISDLGYDHFKD